MIKQASSWVDKVWGETRCLLQSPHYSIYELQVKERGFCSFHYHMNRANRFIVKSGMVRIVWCYGWLIKGITLTDGQSVEVHSLIPHQFQVVEDGVMLEEYFPDRGGTIHNDDIERLTTGGMRDKGFSVADEKLAIIMEDGTLWNPSIIQ